MSTSSKRFISFAALFMIYFMFSALPSAMLTPLLSSLGYSNQEIGFLYSLGAISGIILSTLIGKLADLYRRLKPFVMSALICSMIITALLFNSSAASYMVFVFGIIAASLSRLLSGILDSWAVESDVSIRTHYGAIRAFGSIGFALSLGVLVKFVDVYGFKAILPINVILGIIGIVLIFTTPDVSPLKRVVEKVRLKQLFTPLYSMWVLVFFFVFFVIGVEDMTITMKMIELKASASQIAWFFSAQALFELPIFLLGAKLMRRFGSIKILIVATIAMSVKMFLFSWSGSIGTMLGFTFIQMLTFPLFMITSKHLIYEASHPSLKISGQMVGGALYGNLSGVLAPMMMGSLASMTNATTSLFALGALLFIPLLITLGYVVVQRKQSLTQQQ
ncbi:MAG: MFS transporter [Erysipelotrichaceae bacterium]|nr:MFS transporter [Erysipelotrichaceae bacterium]